MTKGCEPKLETVIISIGNMRQTSWKTYRSGSAKVLREYPNRLRCQVKVTKTTGDERVNGV